MCESSQERIWEHYQNHATHVFEASHPRLDYLVRFARGLSRAKDASVLNIGIGDGHFEKGAQQLGWQVHSLDPDQGAVDKLIAIGIDARQGVIEALPFANATLDFVVASEVLEHLDDAQRRAGIQEIHRVLKPGGFFLGTVPYREVMDENMAICPKCGLVFHRYGHQATFDLAAMRQQLQAQPFKRVRCIRKAFVDFRKRSWGGKLKGLMRQGLAKWGSPLAVANILFAAQK